VEVRTFVFILKDKGNVAHTDTLLAAHVHHLRRLSRSGHMVLCGPFQDGKGALEVLRAESRAEAIQMIEADPFIREGYYAGYDVHELLEANEVNRWLME
jgi:uncharacterized protein YciI